MRNETNNYEIRLSREQLRGRSFLLGNKRAFSLSLPASVGPSASLLHPHKWFGAYQYGKKLLESQVVRLADNGEILCGRQQVGFTMGLTSARREYEVRGQSCTEEYFVPDGLHAFVCELSGNFEFSIEPEFDMRVSHAAAQSLELYEVLAADPIVVSRQLPAGRYDDMSESFVASGADGDETIYAAVQMQGEYAETEILPPEQRARRKVFRKDAQRRRFLSELSGVEAEDHAPLWREHTSTVYTPVRMRARNHACVYYGFGASEAEAVAQLEALRDALDQLRAEKALAALATLEQAGFQTGSRNVDLAYAHVLMRLMDALVGRDVWVHAASAQGETTLILAGNQYFHDAWKRDENIAVGFLLALGFYKLARAVISDTWRFQDDATGRLPQRIRRGESLSYHSSDGTLWALWRLHQYWSCTGDDILLQEKLPMVRQFIERSLPSTVGGLLPSGRTSSREYLWETWMDTPHTPRHGFPIEIQMLWISCLRAYRPIVGSVDEELERRMEQVEAQAWQSLRAFNVRGTLADSLDEEGGVRDFITPNAFFAFATGLDLGFETEHSMRVLGRRQLAGRKGIKTLAPEDWSRVFSPEFLANRRHVRGRRMRSVGKLNYHRGVEWNWLAQFFVLAELKYGDANMAYRKYLAGQVESALKLGGVGGISELHDLTGARGPDFQTWSMAGFLAALHAFAGVAMDVPARRIRVEPQIPAEWDHLKVRKWYADIPFDIIFTRDLGALRLDVQFPSNDPPDVEIEISLILPPGKKATEIEVLSDGAPISPGWRTEILAGTHRLRLTTSLPATNRLEVDCKLARTALRNRATA